MRRHRRAGPDRGQGELLRRAPQRLCPVRDLPARQAVGVVRRPEQVPLPDRVIRVLHRQRRPPRGAPLAPRRVGRRQVPRQRSHRPAVRHRMVHHQHQHPLTGGDLEQVRPHQRLTASQVEPLASDGAPPRRPSSPSVTGDTVSPTPRPRQVDGPAERRTPSTSANTVRRLSCRPTTSSSACPSASWSRVAGQPDRQRHVVGGRAALQPVEEPQPLLRERRRHRPAALPAHQRRADQSRRLVQRRGDPGHGRGLEHRPDRQLHVERGPDPGDQPHRQDAVPAQVEEPVIDPGPVNPQHVGEDAAQDLLLRGARLPERRQPRSGPARAAPPGPPSRSPSAAARPAPRPRTAPCNRAAPRPRTGAGPGRPARWSPAAGTT